MMGGSSGGGEEVAVFSSWSDAVDNADDDCSSSFSSLRIPVRDGGGGLSKDFLFERDVVILQPIVVLLLLSWCSLSMK
jgi:hypothetical protein